MSKNAPLGSCWLGIVSAGWGNVPVTLAFALALALALAFAMAFALVRR